MVGLPAQNASSGAKIVLSPGRGQVGVMKYVLIGIVGIAIVLWLFHSSGRPTVRDITYADLTAGEQKVQALVREVHGAAIIKESFVRDGEDVFAKLELDKTKSKLSELTINLSSLARKQQSEGLTDAALKVALRF